MLVWQPYYIGIITKKTNIMRKLFQLSGKTGAIWLLTLCMMCLFPNAAMAVGNDYLEKQSNYTVTATGQDVIHFSIPMYSYYSSVTRDFYVHRMSYIYIDNITDVSGTQTIAHMFTKRTADDSENDDEDSDKGSAYLNMEKGKAIVTSMQNGINKLVNQGEESGKMIVKKGEDDGFKVSKLEFDWYPPTELNGKTFRINLRIYLYANQADPKDNNSNYDFDWHYNNNGINFTSNDNVMAPMLMEPYLYTVNESGVAGYGAAVVPFMAYQTVYNYRTSLAPNDSWPVKNNERAGMIPVQTTDTVQTGFYATFEQLRNAKTNERVSIQSNSVNIPPYHRIYDFNATAETDATGTYTGNHVLTWNIKNAHLTDLMDGDFFEIERALKADFSDARQVTVTTMSRNKGTYTFVDNSRETWTGNAQEQIVGKKMIYTMEWKYPVRDQNGNVTHMIAAHMTNDKAGISSVPVYYRIRRASSSVWGWNEDLAKTASLLNTNFLAPLAPTQENYTKDPDYDTNHKVNFRFRIENSVPKDVSLPDDGFRLTVDEIKAFSDSVTIRFVDERKIHNLYTDRYPKYEITYRGNTIRKWDFFENREWRVPTGATIQFRFSSYKINENVQFRITDDYGDNIHYETLPDENNPWTPELQQYLIDSLKPLYIAKYQEEFSGGKCMWDNSAKLVLVRTIQETGQSMEFIVPPDSIRRQVDGSWIATFSDFADRACSHYSYSVRIDQTNADLHVLDSLQLNPIALSGPNLYFDESATITRFTATQGEASTAMKNGVLLRWEVNSNAVDEYVLTRVRMNSDASPDTLYRGDDTDFFDRTALPDVHYEYAIATHYSCNGKSTSNAATTEGWRTPYGEISGYINMPDNSGMAGVQVTLQDTAGHILHSMITDASGFFRFDSLLYDGIKGSVFTVIPASQYGTFSYNSTSALSATVSLTAEEAVGSGIDFVNTSAARLTGRALYKMSTVPVPGAMFLLNGDTVRHGNEPVTTGTDGNFELILPTSQPCKLQVFKPGHVFEGDGILRVEQDKDSFALTKPLDGVRFYDMTKVRLIGRVAGGNDQRDLKRGFGLGKNNLGDNVQLVLQLEGDNTAQLVHDPDELTRDTVNQTIQYASVIDGTVTTNTLFEKKRIVLNPDPKTGEYAVDLFPVKYKVVQATANGYATLFAAGQGAETFDLINAPLTVHTDTLQGKTVQYNAVYDRIYHNPVVLSLNQVMYGVERKGYGEPEMEYSSINPMTAEKVSMYTEQADGSINYLMGYPVFISNRRYQFVARAYEEYVYNNNRNTGEIDRVAQRGGEVIVHNGLHSQTDTLHFILDGKGENRAVWLSVDRIDTRNSGTDALRTVSALLKTEGNAVETTAFQAFVSGVDYESGDLIDTESSVVLLDIIRDPAGTGSSAWVEAGSTYTFGYSESFYWNIGVDITLMRGINVTQDIGTVSAPQGIGTYMGSNFQTSRLLSIPIPVSHDWSWGYSYNYAVTNSDRISTSTGMTTADIGAPADVFYGTTISQLAGKLKAVAVISDSLYQARQPAINAGIMKVLGQGTAPNGENYYLVTGQKIALGSKVNNTFVYTQDYVINTLIPKLAIERKNLMMTFPDSASAQAYADGIDEPVYWDKGKAATTADTAAVAKSTYLMINPNNDRIYTNRIAALDNMIAQWVAILYGNEKEKVNARMGGSSREVGTWSISSGTNFTHVESYSSTAMYNEMPQSAKLWGQQQASNATIAGSTIMSDWQNIVNFFGTMKKDKIGETVESALEKIGDLSQIQDDPADPTRSRDQQVKEMGSQTNSSKFNFNIQPTTLYMPSYDSNQGRTITKNTGFSLSSDNMGDLTVAVYRANLDSTWRTTTASTRDKVGANKDDQLYGSYVFYTVAGSTYCPHEDEERTKFYNPGTVISNGTQWVAKPEMSIDTYEQSAVMPDKRAVFHVTLMNNSTLNVGRATYGSQFNLSVIPNSNPNGARITMDGQPLTQGMGFWLVPGVPVTKTLEVERGTVDDYENLTLSFGLADCPITFTTLNFSVHFLPVSSPVEITSPRQNWTMNTLSPHDSIGYYLPIEIDGFDIHHKNFDHIEFQYKLSTQSDDDWVSQCSFYADDSLYNIASGNKAMISNGRITPFRFYGERDPMEQKYDLRAVSFCRYGSGFVHKASPVISGTKDTRPPRVFGQPEPTNSILGIGDNLRLRFNEAIAGNYLDEDNNFQVLGVTNEMGITATTALHFDASAGSKAETKVSRTVLGKSFTIDMMIRPSGTGERQLFRTYSESARAGIEIALTADNRIKVQPSLASSDIAPVLSKPLGEIMSHQRVLVAWDNEKSEFRIYAGTMDMTDTGNDAYRCQWGAPYAAAPFTFGDGYTGDMLETRVWTKALTLGEIAATANHHLTGYERELTAYYRMNEGKGETVTDRAHGAMLYLDGCSWNKHKGFSIKLTKNQTVKLAGNLLGRSTDYDATYMLWFRTADNSAERANIFSAGRTDNEHGVQLAIENGAIVLVSDTLTWHSPGNYADGEWHHIVLTINRTFNNASVFVDGNMLQSFPATYAAGVQGAMYLGGNFAGNIDEFAVFEQAMPKTLLETYDNITLHGDEMGLVGYLTFEEQKQNPNGVLEQVFSLNDRRIYRDPLTLKEIKKEVLLVEDIMASGVGIGTAQVADNTQNAPVSDHGQLTKMNFDWAFNGDELLINLNMLDREINKQPVYVTVRDVEDLNGNPMASPVTWTAFVDRNSLKWENDKLEIWVPYGTTNTSDMKVNMRIVNHSGRRHTYRIESLYDWMSVEADNGSIQPTEKKELTLKFDVEHPVGDYFESDGRRRSDRTATGRDARSGFSALRGCGYQPRPVQHVRLRTSHTQYEGSKYGVRYGQPRYCLCPLP